MTKRSLSTLAVLLGLMAGTAMANPPLRDVTHVREGLITAGMAIELGDQCGDVSVRLFRGLNFLNGLKSHARGLGYSEAAISAYVDDDAEKARLEEIARARLVELGVLADQPASYCTVARDQIDQATPVGRLLR